MKLPMSVPDIDSTDEEAVLQVLRSGRLALGPRSVEFERAIAQYVGVREAIVVSSGTAALHLLIRALGIGPGDEVVVPSFTFAATANVVMYEGAVPVFADIEPETYCVDTDDIKAKLSERTKAILVVDVFGHPADWDSLERIAEHYGLPILDDACEALGAEYKGRKIGSYGRAAAFAFYPNKQITTGEGGVIVTNDAALAAVCRSLRNQGRSEMGPWLEHERLGFNYRMDEMSAALGLSQLRRIEQFLAKRDRVAHWYTERLKNVPGVRAPVVKPHVRMSWFVYVVTLEEGLDREPVMRVMEEQGIPTRAYFSPVHLQPYMRERFGYRGGELPVTESAARRTIALPFHNNLTLEEVEMVVDGLRRAVERVGSTRSGASKGSCIR
ncbi:polysaccharide biosynthesis protein [Caldinitratiruptor microaerophilus]|uniref:Polysaccharide biosynthesis protein n=2 Tax=Caldinitratiruptor microaerophilus TaxID=671077 RepID=A0AA35CN17_9FIRM|nr:polysaccharide biosynthesis protein [Caldinitratiruptor microaerophilus]